MAQTSILENIRYGNPSATDAEIEQAAIRAYAHDFIVGKTPSSGFGPQKLFLGPKNYSFTNSLQKLFYGLK